MVMPHFQNYQSNKQQTNKTLYLHILNLNTVALQISKEMLFEAGKSNCIMKTMKISQVNITLQKLICIVTIFLRLFSPF